MIMFTLSSCAINFDKIIPNYSLRICSLEGGCGTVFNAIYDGKVVGVTNSHVCRDALNMSILTESGKKLDNVQVLGSLEHADICFVERVKGLEPLRVSSKEVKVHDIVVYQGYPLGKRTTSTGKVIHTSIDMFRGWSDLIYITNYTNYGASGSPVVNLDGRLVGVIVMKNVHNQGYFIKADKFAKYIKGL